MEITVGRIREAACKYEELAQIVKKYENAEKTLEIRSRGSYRLKKVLLFCVVSAMLTEVAVVIVCFGSLVRHSIIYESLGDSSQMFDALYASWVVSMLKLSKVTILIASVILLPLSFFCGLKSAKKGLRIATEKNTIYKTALGQFLKENEEIINILPKSYRYPLAANYIADVLESGRADTMKEALNLYEEQLHRWRLENKMNKLLEQQKRVYSVIWFT